MSSPSMLQNADHLKITNAVMNNTSHYHHYESNVSQAPSSTALKRYPTPTGIFLVSSEDVSPELYSNIAVGAMHNSAERCNAPKCHEDTRVTVQDEILSWITHEAEDATKIKWVAGPAGTGKTAIMGSIAENCQKNGTLAGSFFFSSFSPSPERRSKKHFVATLAYQLCQHPDYQDVGRCILENVEKDPAIFEKRLADQVDSLILAPFRRSLGGAGSAPSLPKVLIVDGLDECEALDHSVQGHPRTKEDDQCEVLSALLQISTNSNVPFRVLVASRPERAIKNFLDSPAARHTVTELFLDLKYDPDTDIKLFLTSKLADLGRRYKLPDSWVPIDAIRAFVRDASGQFIYAATIVKFIETPTHSPQRQLERVLQWRTEAPLDLFSSLDALYAHILRSSPDPQLAIEWIVAAATLSPLLDSHWYAPLFESYAGETDFLLGNLTSLVCLKRGEGLYLRSYHKSFVDYFNDSTRCGGLYVGNKERRHFLSDRLARALKRACSMAPPIDHSDFDLDDFFFDFHFTVRRASRENGDDKEAIEAAFRRETDPATAAWWVGRAFDEMSEVGVWKELRAEFLEFVFNGVHRECRWGTHTKMCTMWVTEIVKTARKRGMYSPTDAELFKTRFRKDIRAMVTASLLLEKREG